MALLSIVTGIAEAFLEQRDVRQVVQQLAVGLVPDQVFRIRPGVWFLPAEVVAVQLVELLVIQIIHYYITGLVSMAGQFSSSCACLPSGSCLHYRRKGRLQHLARCFPHIGMEFGDFAGR